MPALPFSARIGAGVCSGGRPALSVLFFYSVPANQNSLTKNRRPPPFRWAFSLVRIIRLDSIWRIIPPGHCQSRFPPSERSRWGAPQASQRIQTVITQVSEGVIQVCALTFPSSTKTWVELTSCELRQTEVSASSICWSPRGISDVTIITLGVHI